MSTDDRCCTIAPYFKVSSANAATFRALCEKLVAKAREEPKCLYYGFSFNGDEVHCREGYEDAEGLLAHIDHVGPLLREAAKISEITRLEVHGPEEELAKLRKPLSDFPATFFVLEFGFRR